MGMKILLTGGAGFIGSCVLQMLNENGIENIIVVDNIAETEKWKNLVNKKYSEYIHKEDLLGKLSQINGLTHIIHIGACSSTTEKNFDYLYKNNTEYSKSLYRYSAKNDIRFIYASSAATYGDGSKGFDDEADIMSLRPLNGYGYSKQLFDIFTLSEEKKPPQCVGLKFFNVYGPNEYFKGTMASVIFHGYNQIKTTGKLKLFKSYNKNYKDGGQLRDFVYIKDICSVIKYFLDHPEISGLYNVGTGSAESFETLGKAIFSALNLPPSIAYIEMPDYLKPKYQYFTEATIKKLRGTGYNAPFYPLTHGVADYVENYLEKDFRVL
jgi:ADP-L-glycero-D-manno-heptose 6-epimerase